MSKLRIAPFRATDWRHLAVSSLRDGGLSRTDQAVLSKHMAHSLHTADTKYDESRQFDARPYVLERAEEVAREAAREEFEAVDVDPVVQENVVEREPVVESAERDSEVVKSGQVRKTVKTQPKSTHIPPATASGSKSFEEMNESEQR